MDFRDIKEFLKDTFKYIIVAVIVIVIVIYVVSLTQVVGPSMSPNYNEGDIIVVSKLHYKLFGVKRNDIISFEYADTKYLIKRVIGLPGEKIEYIDNVLYINGVGYKETIVTNLQTENFSLSDIGYDTIPNNMYLVLGDNRNNSMDSRDEKVGLISKKDIIGKCIIRVWPITGIKLVN